jgi:hypothetical protein
MAIEHHKSNRIASPRLSSNVITNFFLAVGEG